MSRFFVVLTILGGVCLAAGNPTYAQTSTPSAVSSLLRVQIEDLKQELKQQQKRAPQKSVLQAQINALQAQRNALQAAQNPQNDDVLRPGLPPKKSGPGDRIPPSISVFGLKRANGRMWGTNRRGRPLVALSPRAILIRPKK